eukprot:759769-Hanusia_phi.AAC.3
MHAVCFAPVKAEALESLREQREVQQQPRLLCYHHKLDVLRSAVEDHSAVASVSREDGPQASPALIE